MRPPLNRSFFHSVLRRIGFAGALCAITITARANNCQTTPSPTPYPTPTPYANGAGFDGGGVRVRPLAAENSIQHDIKDHLLLRRTFTQPEIAAFDINHDGIVDVADYTQAWITTGPGNLSDFTRPGDTIFEGLSLISVPVQFALPFTGLLTYTVTGSATPGVDYQGLTGQQTVDGRLSDEILILVNDDDQFENAETIVITLSSSPGYSAGLQDTYTIIINDNDARLSATADSGLSRSDFEVQFTQLNGQLTGALAGNDKSLIPAGLWPLDLQFDAEGTLTATSGLFPLPAAAAPFEGATYQRQLSFVIKGFDPAPQSIPNRGSYQETFTPSNLGGAFAFTRQGTLSMARIGATSITPDPVLTDAP